MSHPAAPGGKAPGQNGGWLGRTYDPFLAEGNLADPRWSIPSLALADGIPLNRLQHREALLHEINRQQLALEAPAIMRQEGEHARAAGLLASSSVRSAFDLSEESDATRDRYGRNIHGQGVLLARRDAMRRARKAADGFKRC